MPRIKVSRKKSLAGAVFPRYSGFLDKLNWNARWMEAIGNAGEIPVFEYRDHLHAFINDTYFNKGNDPVDYLEFGVYRGDSLRLWSGLNRNSLTRIYGFDSFEGLPEDWLENKPKGMFSTNGQLPDIPDSRIEYIVGWFQRSLPGFLSDYDARNRLLIHNDSDLFSSTLYCLTMLNPLIKPGTIVIFDEFDAVLDEYRALVDYSSAFLRTFRIVAATDGYQQVAVVLD